MKLCLILERSRPQEQMLADAWGKAVAAMGWQRIPDQRPLEADIIICWGVPEQRKPEFKRWREAGKTVLVLDYPYWNRKSFVKISLNGLHPTAYLMREIHGAERYLATQGPEILPWRAAGEYILLAGMGPKGCQFYDQRKGEWDEMAITTMRKHSDMQIVYRAKPSDRAPRRFTGVVSDDTHEPIARHFNHAHAVVTHHGNAVVEALAAGVPIFCSDGVGVHMGLTSLSEIMRPVYPDNREQFFWNLAHWQWSPEEIATGLPLCSLRERELI